MSRLQVLFLLLYFLPTAYCPLPTCIAQGTWVQKANFGGGTRIEAVGFSIGSKGYIGTGMNCYSNLSCALNDLWEYDPVSDAWTQKANVPGALRTHAVALSIGYKGYVGIGSSSDMSIYYNDFWEYDPAMNTWTQKANFPGVPRVNISGFSIAYKGYLAAGYRTNINYNELWEYSALTNSWSQKANFPMIGRSSAAEFSIGNKGYLSTGWHGNAAVFGVLKDLWEYDPIVDAWTQKADIPAVKRSDAVGFSIGNFGYISTGDSIKFQSSISIQLIDLAEVWQYSPATNTWAQMTNYGGGGVACAAGFAIGCKGYVGTGGIFSNPLTIFKNDFWEFTPPIPSAAIAGINTICSGDSTSLFASGGLFYQWSTGETTMIIDVRPTVTTAYSVVVSDGCGSSTAGMTVTVIPTPIANFSSKLNLCEMCAEFTNSSLNGITYAWNFGDSATSASQNNNHCYGDTGTYSATLIVYSATGMCRDTASANVIFYDPDETQVIVPNVFTPNGDGINDVFKIPGLDKCEPYSIKIYDRWGNFIFATEKTGLGWDGRTSTGINSEAGVYYYVLTNASTTKKGFVTLLR